MFRPVLSKADFVHRYMEGEFGNRSPTWPHLDNWTRSRADPDALYHIRNRVKGARTWYNVRGRDLELKWREAVRLYSPRALYISAMAPTERTLFQGEICYGLYLYDLTYTTVAKPMRDALAQHAVVVNGLRAKMLLEHYLPDRDLEWLLTLLERYPDHVVEFSTYSVVWGTVPGFHTVFWEVRKY